jgi:hypothetical protein
VLRKAVYVQIAASMKEEVLISSKCYRRVHYRWRSSQTPAQIEVSVSDSRVGIAVDMNCWVLCSRDVKMLQLLPGKRSFVLPHLMQQKHMTFAARFLKLGLRCMIRELGVTRLPLLPLQPLYHFSWCPQREVTANVNLFRKSVQARSQCVVVVIVEGFQAREVGRTSGQQTLHLFVTGILVSSEVVHRYKSAINTIFVLASTFVKMLKMHM